MGEKRKFYLLFGIGLVGSLVFLLAKMALYDKLEYELDLFTILQLSRDFLWDKPFLYENAYGYNSAIHNYYLVPFCAPLTLVFGGKGLFLAGFILMVWAWWLVSKLLQTVSFGKAILFSLLFFSPTAFFLWDNFHFGWHAENFFYPLCVALMASLILRQRTSIFISALCLIINREDGVLLALSIFIIYKAAENKDGLWNFFKKLFPYIFSAAILFVAGIILLQILSHGNSRVNDTIQRFLSNYNGDDLSFYISDTSINWLLLCGVVWMGALAVMRKWRFALWSLLAMVPIMAANIYSGAYYFPDPKYGINWAPRLAGIYGFLVAMFLVCIVSKKEKYNYPSHGILFVSIGIFICYIQCIGLARLHYYQQYSVWKRLSLALFENPPKENNWEVLQKLHELSDKIPTNYPVRMDLYLFAIFDHTDFIWPNKNKHPLHSPKILILSAPTPDAEPIPDGFNKVMDIGKYGVWIRPENAHILSNP